QREEGDSLGGSATPTEWLIANGRSLLYAGITDPARRQNERELFPGLMLFALAAAALGTRKKPPSAADGLRTRPTWWLDAIIVVLLLATYAGAVADQTRVTWHGRVLLLFNGTGVPATLLVIAIVARLVITGRLRRALAPSLDIWIPALWIVVGFVGSLGLHAFFHSF